VRGVLENFFLFEFDRPRSVVRIGVSGKGIIPNYAIEQPERPVRMYERRHCFHGRNHREILDDSAIGMTP
jgi:hypothetical protein